MIAGKVDDLPLFFNLHPALEYIHKFLVEYKAEPKETGTYELLPGRIKANVCSYSTVEPKGRKLEAHKSNCDVQVMVKGKELVEWAPLQSCGTQLSEEYSSGGDIAFYADPKNGCGTEILDEDTFLIFRPEDAHKPCLKAGAKCENVTKIIFKFVID